MSTVKPEWYLSAEREWDCYQGAADEPAQHSCGLCTGERDHAGGISSAEERTLAMMFMENRERMSISSFCRYFRSQHGSSLSSSVMMPYYKAILSSGVTSNEPVSRDKDFGKFPIFELEKLEHSNGDVPDETMGASVSTRVVGWILMEMYCSAHNDRITTHEKLTNEQIVKLLNAGAKHSPTVSVVCEFLLPVFMLSQRPSKEQLQELGLSLLRHPKSPVASLGWCCLAILWWRSGSVLPCTLPLARKAFQAALRRATTGRMRDMVTKCIEIYDRATDDATYFKPPVNGSFCDYPSYPACMISAYRSLIHINDLTSLKLLVESTPAWLLKVSPYLNLTHLLAQVIIADDALYTAVLKGVKITGQAISKDQTEGLGRNFVYLAHNVRKVHQPIYSALAGKFLKLITDEATRQVDKLEHRQYCLALMLRCRVLETLRDTLGYHPARSLANEAYQSLVNALPDRESENESERVCHILVMINALCAFTLDESAPSANKLKALLDRAKRLTTSLPPLDTASMSSRYLQSMDTEINRISVPVSEIMAIMLRTQSAMAQGYFAFQHSRDVPKSDQLFKLAYMESNNSSIDAYIMRVWCLSKTDPYSSWGRDIAKKEWAAQLVDTLLKRSGVASGSFEQSLLQLTKQCISLLPGAKGLSNSLESKRDIKHILANQDRLGAKHLMPLRILVDVAQGVSSLEQKVLRLQRKDIDSAKSNIMNHLENLMSMLTTSALVYGRMTEAHYRYLNRLLILFGKRDVTRLPIVIRCTAQTSSKTPTVDSAIGSLLFSFTRGREMPVVQLPETGCKMKLNDLLSLLCIKYDVIRNNPSPFFDSLLQRKFVMMDQWKSRRLRKISYDSMCPSCHLRTVLTSLFATMKKRFDPSQLESECQGHGGTEMCLLYQTITDSLDDVATKFSDSKSNPDLAVGQWQLNRWDSSKGIIELVEESWTRLQ